MINYNIKGTGVPVTDELRSYVEKKLAAAEKFLQGDSTAHTDVEFEFDPRRDPSSAKATEGKGGKYRAEFTVSSGGSVYRAEEWGTTLHEAIDVAQNELLKELRRTKRKNLHLMRRGGAIIKDVMRGLRDRF